MKSVKEGEQGGVTMNASLKPSVFEVKTTRENREEVYERISKPRLSSAFLEQCKKTSQELRIPKK